MISSPYCALSRVCDFCFVSCKTSQNVSISQLLTRSNFKASKTAIMDAQRSKLFASFFLVLLNETTSQL